MRNPRKYGKLGRLKHHKRIKEPDWKEVARYVLIERDDFIEEWGDISLESATQSIAEGLRYRFNPHVLKWRWKLWFKVKWLLSPKYRKQRRINEGLNRVIKESYLPVIQDAIFNSTPLLYRMMQQEKEHGKGNK